jgi:DNA-binding transcriptional MerR regulator
MSSDRFPPDSTQPNESQVDHPVDHEANRGQAPLRSRRGGYSIGEVGEHLDLEAHVLRYWESEFEELMPKKDAAGRRVYSDADVRTLQRIRHLLKEERYTIAGARAVLDREGVHGRKAFRDDLRDLRDFLVDLRDRI